MPPPACDSAGPRRSRHHRPNVRLDLPADRARLEQTVAQLAPAPAGARSRSCACTASTRTPAARSRRCSPTCATCSDGISSPCSSCITPEKAAAACAPARRCAARSEFHAWGDSNLYLRRDGAELTLTVEHRAAPSPPAIELELAQRGDALALEVLESTAAAMIASPPSSIDERITTAIAQAIAPLPIRELRALCRVRNATLYERLTALTDAGHLVRGPTAIALPPSYNHR